MSVLSRKILTGAVAALALGAALSTSVSTAEAGWRGGWGHGGGWGRGGWGAPVAAGVIGGLALGAIAAQAAQPHYAYPVADPTYGYQTYGDASYCHVERRPTYNPYGYFAGWQAVRVCQ